MLPPFDIFRREASGDVLWIKSAEDLKSASAAVRELMASAPHEYIIHSHRTNNDLVVKPRSKRLRKSNPAVFQIAYDDVLMTTRAGLLNSYGFKVISVLGNEAAKAALTDDSKRYALFIIGRDAATPMRRDMAAWLKSKYPNIPVLALNPPYEQQLKPADYNIILDGPEEWLFIVEAAAA
jgi:hypothetical protein